MEQRSEPTTDEIVRALRTCNNPKGQRCSQCAVFSRYDNARDCKRTIDKYAADRLESQQRDLLQLTAERDAEKARADAAVKDIERIAGTHSICHLCDFVDMIGCCHKNHCDGLNLFRLRGEKGKATE